VKKFSWSSDKHAKQTAKAIRAIEKIAEQMKRERLKPTKLPPLPKTKGLQARIERLERAVFGPKHSSRHPRRHIG